MPIPSREQRGVTIIEAVMWLVIATVVIAGVLGLFSVVQNNQRETATRQLVQQIIGSVRGLYVSSTNYSGLTAAVLVNAGEIPEQYSRSPGTATATIQTPEGDPITLSGWDGGWALGIESGREGTCIAVLSDYVNNDQLTGAATLATVPASITDSTATATAIVATIAAINTACLANSNMVLEFR